MKPVPRIGRALDLAGLLLFLGGGGTFAWSWSGFRGMEAYVPPPDAPAWSAIAMADGYLRMQWIGGGLMVAGVAVFVLAWWVARKAMERG